MPTQNVETYTPFPKQQEFHANPAKYRLFGGAAGPGKSRTILEEGWLQANEVAGGNVLIMRRTYPELEESILKQFRLHIPWRRAGARYNESKHMCSLPNGSTIRFGYANHENDIYMYQGGEYLFIGLDELTLFTLFQWQYLTSRNRCPVPFYTSGPNLGRPVVANMAGASNPGNLGHEWVKALFIDRVPAPGMENPEKYNPDEYAFIPALIHDNPIYANDPAYLATLDALPPHMRQAFLLGDWDIFVGQYFYNFDRTKHVGKRETCRGLMRPWHTKWISIDWGHAHNAAVYWHTRINDLVITYREFVQAKLSPTVLAQCIVDRMPRDEKTGKYTENISHIFLSNETFRPNSWGDHSIPDLMGDVFSEADLPRPEQVDDDRIAGAQLMLDLLQQDNWLISEDCPRLISNIPAMTRDSPDNPEDVKKVDGDDPYDSARYGLKTMLSPGKTPLRERVRERVNAMNIPEDARTVRMMMEAKIRSEEQKKGKPRSFFGPKRWKR